MEVGDRVEIERRDLDGGLGAELRIRRHDRKALALGLADVILRGRHTPAVVKRVGWDGRGGCTYREAAEGTGVSWQAIQQLTLRLQERLEGRLWLLPDGAEHYIGETVKN